MQMYGGVEVNLHTFFLSIRWRQVVNFTPWLLYPRGNSSQYPLARRLGGPQVGLDKITKKFLDPDKN
jgi:hypothetical protein